MKLSPVVVTVLVAAGALAACSSSASAGNPGRTGSRPTSRLSAVASGGDTAPGTLPSGAGGSAAVGATSQVSVRYANLFTPQDKPGPAIDIYDAPEHQAATPIITDLAYGTVSAYVHPHVMPNSTNIVEFYALPTGEDPIKNAADIQGLGGIQDDGSHPQETIVLSADSNTPSTTPLEGLSFSTRVEKGTDNGSKGPVAPAPPAGQGEVLVDTSAVFDIHGLGLYLRLDSSCAPPLNGDPNLPGVPYITNETTPSITSVFAVFAAAPGTHQLALVSWTDSAAPTCAQLTARQGATSTDLAAGQQVEAFVYGTSLTDLHLALAPIAP